MSTGLVSPLEIEFETEELRPVKAWCTQDDVHVTLFDRRTISAPLWWTAVDEGVSIKSIFIGQKAPGAMAPKKAA